MSGVDESLRTREVDAEKSSRSASERAERCRLGSGRRATAKAIRVVVLARAKVDEGSGLRTRKDEEKGGLRETTFYEPAQGKFLYASYLGRGYIHQSCDKVVSPYKSPKRDKTSWRLTGRGESPTRKNVK